MKRQFPLLEYSALLFLNGTVPTVEIVPKFKDKNKKQKEERIFQLPTGENTEIVVHVKNGLMEIELL